MREYLHKAIEIAKSLGAEYTDIRIVINKTEKLALRNENLSDCIDSETLGFGVRVLKNKSWGFSASSILTMQEIENVTKKAVKIASAASMFPAAKFLLAPEPAYQDIWTTPYCTDPFKVALSQKLNLLFETNKILRAKPEITVAYTSILFKRDKIYFANTEGSEITQVLLRSGGGFNVFAVKGGQVQKRSYPVSFGGQHKSGGYEIIESMKFIENAEKVRDEAIALLSAPNCPYAKKDVIIMPNQLFLQIHESTGHASELDRVLGYEENYAGSSFLTTEKYKKFKYGSDIVNLVADATVPGGLATRGYDDDGVHSQRFHIIKNGILDGYMTSREFAHYINEPKSFGCNRADAFYSIPIIRINNLSLMPGAWDFADMLADTKEGLLLDMNFSWSIDQRRLNFQFGVEVAYEIKDGKLGKLYKNCNYQGITPEFWGNCDAIANENFWDLVGVNNCGKGEPQQINEMSHGCAPARFRNVQVGIKPVIL